MNKSIHVLTVLGIPIEINYSWFIIFFLVTWTLAASVFPNSYNMQGLPMITYWIAAVVASFFFFASLLLHELAHSFVAIRNNLPIQGITLFVFGGVAHISKEPQTPGTEFKMAIAGPLCSLSLSLIFSFLALLFQNIGLPAAIVVITEYLSGINLMVCLFNLVPGFPLDGGRILRSAIWSLTGDLKKATLIASSFGKLFAYFLMGFGILLFATYKEIISGIWLILIGFFLQEAASTSYQQVTFKKSLTGVKVRDIMSTNVVTVSKHLTLTSLVDDYFFKYRFTSFPVLSDEGDIEGLITIHAVKDVPRESWVNTTVMEAMIPIKSDLVVSPYSDVFDALTSMAGNGVGRLLVTQDGKLTGIVSQRDVIRLFEVKEDLGE
jgi:Zn-dependent protease/predicted transcriptional regulator